MYIHIISSLCFTLLFCCVSLFVSQTNNTLTGTTQTHPTPTTPCLINVSLICYMYKLSTHNTELVHCNSNSLNLLNLICGGGVSKLFVSDLWGWGLSVWPLSYKVKRPFQRYVGGTTCLKLLVQRGLACLVRFSPCQGST